MSNSLPDLLALMPIADISPGLKLVAVIALLFGGLFFVYALGR